MWFSEAGGLLHYIYKIGIDTGVFPLLIFMGVGAMTDFSALIANPNVVTWRCAVRYFCYLVWRYSAKPYTWLSLFKDASAIAIIGGADGPTFSSPHALHLVA